MLISVEKNFIFVHVAKTGGQALKNTLRPYAVAKAPGQWRRLLSHLPVPEGLDAQFGPHVSARWARLKLPRDFFDHAFKFAQVRNLKFSTRLRSTKETNFKSTTLASTSSNTL